VPVWLASYAAKGVTSHCGTAGQDNLEEIKTELTAEASRHHRRRSSIARQRHEARTEGVRRAQRRARRHRTACIVNAGHRQGLPVWRRQLGPTRHNRDNPSSRAGAVETALELFKKSGEGHMVLVSQLLGKQGMGRGQGAYGQQGGP